MTADMIRDEHGLAEPPKTNIENKTNDCINQAIAAGYSNRAGVPARHGI